MANGSSTRSQRTAVSADASSTPASGPTAAHPTAAVATSLAVAEAESFAEASESTSAAASTPPCATALSVSAARPLCRQHGRRLLALRRVRKAGSNQGRLFYACRGRGCELFEWADRAFPRCTCSDGPLAGLRVSKTQESGGRWFFGCRRSAVERCGHFAWAPADVAQRLGGLLNPLT